VSISGQKKAPRFTPEGWERLKTLSITSSSARAQEPALGREREPEQAQASPPV
jgi:hypothetical protein